MITRGRFVLIAIVTALVLLSTVACGPTAAPTPTPTKAPAAAPTAPAAAATTAVQPTKPAAAATPTTPPKALEPVKLGFITSSSGVYSSMGMPERETIVMLEEKVNKEGGINGRPLQVIYYDDESDDTKGVLAMKKLINDDKVLGIIGTAATGIAMAEAGIVEDAKVAWITMQALRAPVVDKKWIFKIPMSEGLLVEAMYKWMKGEKIANFALLSQGAATGRQTRAYIEATAEKAGLNVVSKEEYGPSDTDMRAQLTRIKGTSPQSLFVMGAEPAGAIAIRQAKEMGINVPIVTETALTTPAILANKELRDGLEGIFTLGLKTDVWDQLPDGDFQKPVLKELAALVKTKYNRPMTNWEGVAYDPFMLMITAMKTTNADPAKVEESRSKIRDAIEQTKNYIGVTSPISYSPTDHEILDPRAAVVGQIRDGKIQVVKAIQ